MEMIGSLYGYENPIAGLVLVSSDLSNYSMINSASSSSRKLKDSTGVNVEAVLQLFVCPYTCTIDIPKSIEW